MHAFKKKPKLICVVSQFAWDLFKGLGFTLFSRLTHCYTASCTTGKSLVF